MKTLFFVMLQCFIVTFIYAGTIDPNTPDERYVEYGSKFKYVGSLCGVYEDGRSFCGSAVAIDDFNILTAAHVVTNVKHCIFKLEDKLFWIEKIIIHKDFEENNLGFADLAIGHSEVSFDLKFYPDLYNCSNEESKVCSMAGYGFTGTFITGAILHDNKKRGGSNVVDRIDKDLIICSASKKTDSTHTSLEFLTASGDSGGGLFIDGKLAGIHSCIIAKQRIPLSKYEEESGHTRVSNFLEWIKENRLVKP
jgi:hypothetical protein